MKTDMDIKDDVVDELVFNPAVNAAGIGVTVKDGVVTLTGHVPSLAEKFAAQHATQLVGGVKAVAVDIEVMLAGTHARDDAEIATTARQVLSLNSQIPRDNLSIMVEDGCITLSGELDWAYQRDEAARAVRHLHGVRSLTNDISIKFGVSPAGVEEQIAAALKRQAEREAHRIQIKVDDGVVHLRGKVKSMAEERAAVGAAFNAPGVRQVVNELEVILA